MGVKIKQVIKKYDSILLWILFCAISFGFSITVPIEVGDEIWNFQNVYKLVNGGILYQDANVIVTPIFFWIGKIFLMCFGGNMISFRIYNAIIFAFLSLLIYQLFQIFHFGKRRSLLYTLFLYCMLIPLIRAGANYNILVFVWVLLGMIGILKYRDKKYFCILHGIILYLVFFTKQNIGIYYAISSTIALYFLSQNKKQTFKIILQEFIIAGIGTILTMWIMQYIRKSMGNDELCLFGNGRICKF